MILFVVEVGQIWEKEGKTFHVPVQEKNLGPHEFEIIRCTLELGGYRWVYPREEGDAPIWTLSDFQNATLMQDKP